jgi:predicted glycosyltransferase
MAGGNNKRKGSDAERLYAKVFRDLGFSFVQTSRYGSRIHDDAGIDLINLPINVQIKAGRQKGMNPSAVIADIKQRISQMFPKKSEEHTNPLVVIHRKEVGRGKKRGEVDDIVHMSFEDFKKLLIRIKWE